MTVRQRESTGHDGVSSIDSQQVMAQLLADIRRSRAGRDAAYRPGPTFWPPRSYEHVGGLWPSTLRKGAKNGLGAEIWRWLNETVDDCVDYNFYSSAWVVQNLLDLHETSSARGVPDDELARTAHVLVERFCDPRDRSSRLVFFWPRLIPSADGGLDESELPTNLDAKAKTLLAARRAARERLSDLGFGNVVQRCFPALQSTRRGRSRFLRIPADFDDSSLYLTIGTRLRSLTDDYPLSARTWPVNPAQLADELLRYAYRPFSPDASTSTIDPRTYYWLRAFLHAHVERADHEGRSPNMVLPVTWAQSAEAARREAERGDQGSAIPHAVNNVDVTVCANVLHGLTAAMLDGPGDWITPDLTQLYGDTAALLRWVIESEVVNLRSDLALVYYPDLETFYWFVARVVGRLRAATNLPPPLDEARVGLQSAMRTATLHLDNRSIAGIEGEVSWQGVLGGDTDRLYATAAAVNALLESWTHYSSGCGRNFYKDTPARVPELLAAGGRFLSRHAMSRRLPFANAFFCASVKSEVTTKVRYPVNVAAYMDGRTIDPSQTPFDSLRDASFTLGVRGYVAEEDFRPLLEQHQFGLKPGLRREELTDLAYWSSEDVTRSMCLLALARCADLVGSRHDPGQ